MKPAVGQNPDFVSKSVTMHIASRNIETSKKLLLSAIDTSLGTINTYNESNTARGIKIHVLVNTNKEGYEKIEKIIPQLGFLDDKKLNSINNSEAIQNIELEINFLKNRKTSYETELSKIKEGENKEYWKEVRLAEKSLFDLEMKRNDLKNQVYFYSIQIDLYEDVGTPQSSDIGDVQFVNMPGVGLTYLNIQNPLSDFSNSVYMGYEIKYLFTRGKSYAVFGAMKAQNIHKSAAETILTDLFLYGFGQDFYPRHLGKGRRKLFNLYSGYRVGGTFASSKNTSKHFLYLTPHLGLELVKTKYILLDLDAGYYIPFYKNNNLRGLQVNASFNFLF